MDPIDFKLYVQVFAEPAFLSCNYSGAVPEQAVDSSGACFAGDCIYRDTAHLSLLHLYQIRNWIPFFFLYAAVCDSAIDFAAHCADVLLQEAVFG